MSIVDKLAYASKLSHVRTAHKLLFSGVGLIVCLAFGSVGVSLLTIIAMSAATLFLGGCRLKPYLTLMAVPMAFLLTGILTVVMTQQSGGDTLVSIRVFGGIYGVDDGSLTAGVSIFLKSLGAVSCLYFFSLNTPMNAFLSYLRKKLPGIVVELMELIYRFIFIIWDEARRIHVAQASRLGYGGFKNSITSTGELVASVFLRAMRRADRMNAALESRGFEGEFIFLTEAETPCRPLVIGAAVIGAALTAVGIIERFLI